MILNPNINILTEAYYGKPDAFKYIESQLADIIVMVDDIFDGKSVDINKSQTLKNIEDAFTKFFKVKKCSISFYSATITANMGANAFTIPSGFATFSRDKNNPKLVDPSKLFLNVNVDVALIYLLKLTPEELMAIILHEIGHCFDASTLMFLSNFTIDINNIEKSVKESILGIMLKGPLSKIYVTLNKVFSSLLAKSKFLQSFWNNYLYLINMWQSFMYKIQRVTTKMPSAKFIAANWVNPRQLFGYGSEKFADSFASSYGYGPALSTAFTKMETEEKNGIVGAVSKIPVLNIGYDMVRTASSVMTLLITADPHPSNVSRVQSQVNKLKRDLKDPNLDPEVRKMIQADINSIEDTINSRLINMKENAKEGRVVSTLYNMMIIKGFNGKLDPREILQVFHKEM